MSVTADAQTGEITTQAPRATFSDLDLASIKSFDDAMRLMSDRGITPESITDYGTGFQILKEKDSLINVPFLIMDWRVNESADFEGSTFVSMAVVTKHGEKFIVNDGSTGIAAQLALVSQTRSESGHPTPYSSLMCPKGLTRSDYKITDEKGKQSSASTYYLVD